MKLFHVRQFKTFCFQIPKQCRSSVVTIFLTFLSTVGTVVHGDILINGRRIGPFMHKISGFVHQEDIFMDNLTVVEHLTFMVKHGRPIVHCSF